MTDESTEAISPPTEASFKEEVEEEGVKLFGVDGGISESACLVTGIEALFTAAVVVVVVVVVVEGRDEADMFAAGAEDAEGLGSSLMLTWRSDFVGVVVLARVRVVEVLAGVVAGVTVCEGLGIAPVVETARA